jgi:hypothetical protein
VAVLKAKLSGGRKVARVLREIGTKMTGSVKVGFLEHSTYPQNYDRDQKRLALLRTVQGRKAPKAAGPAKPAPTLHIAQVAFWDEFGHGATKPRPFFRQTIAEHEKEWGGDMAKIAAATNYDGDQVLNLMGERIRDQIVTSIVKWPADNQPSTVAIKGFNKGLEDRGLMQRAVEYERVK